MTETAWCVPCWSRVTIEEVCVESELTSFGEIDYTITHMVCGHHTQGPGHVRGAAPGAPYAGPQVAVAATTRPWDIDAARARQRQLEGGEDHDV